MNDHVLGCWAKLCECEETHYHSYKCSYGCICPSLRAYGEKVAEEMRAACIKVVEVITPHEDACKSIIPGRSCNCVRLDILAALRVVQP